MKHFISLILIILGLTAVAQNKSLENKKLNILTLGDSNGAAENGWPKQLQKLLPASRIVNKSISGNTIGFDNLDRPELNTLKNIDRYIEETYKELGNGQKLDYIYMNIGTNDTKKVFENRQEEVSKNMQTLIDQIKLLVSKKQKKLPKIFIITPSPMDETKANKEKYSGGDDRIQLNNKKFEQLAAQNKIGFINTYNVLKPNFSEKTQDGVHMNDTAQMQIATEICKTLK
jgi:lysophospholipase L1-like esterase